MHTLGNNMEKYIEYTQILFTIKLKEEQRSSVRWINVRWLNNANIMCLENILGRPLFCNRN